MSKKAVTIDIWHKGKDDSMTNLNIRDMYGNQCTLPKEDFFEQYKFNTNGLSTQKAQELLIQNGKNQVSQSKP